MKGTPDHIQMRQRLTVGLIGLGVVVLLIALAGIIYASVERTPGAGTAGDAAPVNMAIDNQQAGDPLAELGAAPVTTNESAPAR